MRTLLEGTNNIIVDNCKLSVGENVTVHITDSFNCSNTIADQAVQATESKCKKMLSLDYAFECGVYTIEVVNATNERLYINDFERRCEDCNG